MIKSNFHTHTIYCDGKDKPEEIVQAAIKKGFLSLGFSGHSYFLPDKSYTMSPEGTLAYRREIERLKEKYEDTIKIYCGIEQEYYSDSPFGFYDYIIGSVHNVFKNGVYLPVDASAEILKSAIDSHYNGDFDGFAEDYFETVSNVIEKTNADIIGHFDLVLKYSEDLGYYPRDRFLRAAERAVERLCKYGRPFEINTGAIARNCRTIPYPLPEILKMIKKNSGKIVISSDCHNKDYLDFAFDDAVSLAINHGFTEHGVVTEKGIEYFPF